MPGTKALQARKVLTRLESTTLDHSLRVNSVTLLRILMPALLIRICGLGNLALTFSASLATSLSLVTSAVKLSTTPPLALSPSATLFSLSWLRPTRAILAPAPDSVWAMASPKPPLPPTITAVLPLRSIFTGQSFSIGIAISTLGVGLNEQPAGGGHDRGGCHSIHHGGPIVVGVLQDETEHHRRHEACEIAQHVHG